MSDVRNIKIHRLSSNETDQIDDNDQWLTYIDDVDHFLIAYPADYPEERPIFMADISIERTESLSSCSPALTGIPKQTTSLLTDQTIWGKVEPVSIFMQPPPICQPPILNENEDPDPLVKGSRDFGYAYALCSEKEGEIVLICISQDRRQSQSCRANLQNI